MRTHAPFQPADLAALNKRLFCAATRVVPMRDIHAGDTNPRVIGLRHDVDDNPGAFETAVQMAEWEARHGYCSTYYMLHTAPYWRDERSFRTGLECIAEGGHEIGIHANAIAEASSTGGDPEAILTEALGQLRGWGFDVRGTVAHGDSRCRNGDGTVRFVNDEMFVECARPSLGAAHRTVAGVKLKPLPLAKFGLLYDANHLSRGMYLSESGGRWSQPFDAVADGFPFEGQLHILVHPDWWGEAFATEAIAA